MSVQDPGAGHGHGHGAPLEHGHSPDGHRRTGGTCTFVAPAFTQRSGLGRCGVGGQRAGGVRFVNDLRLITSAVSLGHDETLIAYEHYLGARAAALASPFRDHGLIRLAVGLESAQDLLADLDAALTTVYGPNR